MNLNDSYIERLVELADDLEKAVAADPLKLTKLSIKAWQVIGYIQVLREIPDSPVRKRPEYKVDIRIREVPSVMIKKGGLGYRLFAEDKILNDIPEFIKFLEDGKQRR